jgi:DNA-binding IclR family transcriptional regulator
MFMTELKEEAISRRTRGLDRAFEILDFLGQRRLAMRPNEIAAQIGAPRSTVYELVNLLLRNGILEYRGDQGHVFLGRKLYFLGMSYQEEFDLLRECNSILAAIAAETRETAQLCMLSGNKYTVAMMKEAARPFRISSDVGEHIPIPWTASGRLLVSHLSDTEILKLIPEDDFQLPDGRWLPPMEFIAEVRQAADLGYFTFRSIVDSFTQCFAVPVFDQKGECVATICLVAPREDGLQNRDAYLKSLIGSAQELSTRIGASLSPLSKVLAHSPRPFGRARSSS